MTEQKTQQDYWNSRAASWAHQEPLVPNKEELSFMRRQLTPGSSILVLGVTPQLCALALEVSQDVTSVDFAEELIETLAIQGVVYEHMDWLEYLQSSDKQFDTIITDGGLLSVDFPQGWQAIAELLYKRLKPGGIFAARVYITTGKPPKNSYDNPNLNRFVSSMGEVNDNWMVHPSHGDYAQYAMYYTFPPEHVVREVFRDFRLSERFQPDYEEGERFISFAWRRP